jgi:RNA polymerase sigma-70 factor (ECF subfamily)
MTAVLCRHFGLRHVEIAEDIASNTFLKASEDWALNGIPENPIAWLYLVARNKTKDHFRHISVFETRVKDNIRSDEVDVENSFEFNKQHIDDSQLAMIFAVCNPANSRESQIALALQILCGFSVQEIADAFLSKNETIKKRLQRARSNLRNDNFQIKLLTETEIRLRLDPVLKTIYLLFNEGYLSKSGNNIIRKEFCSEAIRLAFALTENPLSNFPKVNALLSLMCFQASRLDTRINSKGEAILFDDQDKNKWDIPLIEKGNYYLINACVENEISPYHLEAAIAYWHTVPTPENKWPHILQLYNQLILMEYSPITALNRTFAFAKVYGYEQAIPLAEKLALAENNYYHALLGHLYASSNSIKAIEHYQHAIRLTKSRTEKLTLSNEIEKLQ